MCHKILQHCTYFYATTANFRTKYLQSTPHAITENRQNTNQNGIIRKIWSNTHSKTARIRKAGSHLGDVAKSVTISVTDSVSV